MKKTSEPLQERLRVIRNLTVSTYGALLNGGTLREELTDPLIAQRVNGLVYKAKTRFDSFKVLVQTVKSGAQSDGAIALAESLVSHVLLIREALLEAGVADLAEQYTSVCEPVISTYFSDDDFVKPEPDTELLRASNRLPSQLKALAPDLVTYWFCVSLAARYAEATQLSHESGLARIIREITFPPEYQQAGLSILNYFAVVLNDKYPDIPVTVSIQQEPNLVTLVVTLPDGSQDKVTKTLNDYGLVVTGKMPAKDLVHDELKALALQQKLELAQMEVRQTRDLIRIQNQYSSKRIESLETEVKNLYGLLGREFTSREKLQEGLLNLTTQLSVGHMGEHATHLVRTLADAISERNADRTKVLLEDIQSSQPALFSQLSDFFMQAATSGVIGNYVYDWLKVLWPIMPK